MTNSNYKKLTPSIWCSKRLLVAITLFLGFSNTSVLMLNIDIAIIEMTSSTLITVRNHTITIPPEFPWDRSTIGVVSSMHSYAGFFPFVGSYLASKVGGSISCAISLVSGGILTILHQLIVYINFYLFLACRFLVGLSLTSYFVSAAEIYSRWFPKGERSSLISIAYSGLNMGLIITYPLYGYVAERWGWQMVFYTSGTISVISSILVLAIVKNHPSEDKWLSKEELIYILEETETPQRRKVNHPYRKIYTSVPVLALCAAEFSISWIQSLLYETLPLYVKDATQKSTGVVGLISSIPIIAPPIVYPLSGIMLDYWKNHSNITLTRMHKLMMSMAFITIGILFIVVISISDFVIILGIFVLILVIQSTVGPIIDSLPVHLAPNDASIVAGLIAMTESVGYIIPKTLAGLLTTNHTTQEWNNCFLISDIVLVLGFLIFLKYGSSKSQSWSLPEEDDERRYLMENDACDADPL